MTTPKEALLEKARALVKRLGLEKMPVKFLPWMAYDTAHAVEDRVVVAAAVALQTHGRLETRDRS